MCSRFELTASSARLAHQFNLPAPPPMANTQEFRPTNQVLVIESNGHGASRAWGVPAPWDGKPIFNARAETLLEKPTFRPYLAGRCLVPASAYFEWRKDGKNRAKMRVRPSNNDTIPFAFAGLADANHVTIVTCQAAPPIAHIHSRMPVLLDSDRAGRWLGRSKTLIDLRFLLEPYDLGQLAAEPAEEAIIAVSPQPDLFE